MTGDQPVLATAQVDRLGERLRAVETVSEDDLILLQRFREEHVDALRRVQDVISLTLGDVAQTSRIKTIQTLVDKLRRQPTKLSRVQDIAGIRIVKDMGRIEQNEMVVSLLQVLPGSKMLDRRAAPSFGYRAVHVMARHGRCLVEIQVRTHLQDLWAQIVERLGDLWGRQIRYGGEPDDPTRAAGAGSRLEVWHLVQDLSGLIDGLETLEAAASLRVIDSHTADELSALRREIREALAGLTKWIERSELL